MLMKVLLGIVGVLVVLLVLGAILFWAFYVGPRNQMVTLNETVKSDWAQVDVVLQRRSDLIPNLVETVKGFAAHEETVYNDIAQARAALGGAQTPKDKIAANGQLDSALSRLLVVVENYPQLKSNENFLRLQDELAGTENRIAVERKRYDDAIQEYNTYILKFPNNIIASIAGFQRNDAYFSATPESRAVPKVQFPGAASSTAPTAAPATH
jgi:LemA protein